MSSLSDEVQEAFIHFLLLVCVFQIFYNEHILLL